MNYDANFIKDNCRRPEYRDTGKQVKKRDSISFSDFDEKDGDQVRRYKGGDEKKMLNRGWRGTSKISVSLTKRVGSWRNKTYKPKDHNDVILIEADKDHAKWSRSKYCASNNPDKTIYTVSVDDDQRFEDFEEFLKSYTDVDVKKVSNMPDRPKNKKSKPSDKADADWLEFDNLGKYGDSKNRRCWGLSKLPHQGTYVLLSRYKWKMEDDGNRYSYKTPKKLRHKIKSLEYFGFNEVSIMGIKERYLDEIKDDDGWVPLKKTFEEIAEFFYNDYKDAICLYDSCNGMDDDILSKLISIFKEEGDLEDPKLKNMKSLFEEVDEDLRHKVIFKRLKKLSRAFESEFEEIIEEDDYDDSSYYTVSSLKEMYPLIDSTSFTDERMVNFKEESWAEYLDAVYEMK